ncbi:hypothetical protein Taro_038928 [Colocasia esculenta]|uniref:Uncharacterized protein n=1 Tax=Colocasia esculenta TaxID=4460 RepID=A0A843WHB1_COLES|nr:hypothetical protein [Colocasia esculenta]
MCATCSAHGSGRWEGDAQVRCDLVAMPRSVAESGRSGGNTRRLLHSAFFAKVVLVSSALALVALWEAVVFETGSQVVDGYRGYLSSWVPQFLFYCFRYLLLVCSVLGEFLTEPVTSEAHPYSPQVVVMADRRDWGGGGDDPEELTQRMIERIWESLTEIQMRMDQ